MTELLGSGNKKEAIKRILKKLHEGAKPEELKEEFKEIVKGAKPLDIVKAEEELIKEGIPAEEVRKLCEVHLAVFKDSIEEHEVSVPEWHPIYILVQEHKEMLKISGRLEELARSLKGSSLVNEKLVEQLKHVVEHLKESEKHYLREENVLFPYLEKYGVTEPPKIMWMEHDEIRAAKKRIYDLAQKLVESKSLEAASELVEAANLLSNLLVSHFYKENNVLFPTALELLSEEEWLATRKEFDEVGYCCFTPRPTEAPAKDISKAERSGEVSLETGSLSLQELEAILNTPPVDITFVDKDDTVRYFNQSRDRIFLRTKAVIGRKVQNCHPKKSLHIVNKILEDFKSGKRDSADFWINKGGRLIYIRYFAVRGKNGEYLGCLEVTQDVTEIKKLEGEKRIYDEAP